MNIKRINKLFIASLILALLFFVSALISVYYSVYPPLPKHIASELLISFEDEIIISDSEYNIISKSANSLLFENKSSENKRIVISFSNDAVFGSDKVCSGEEIIIDIPEKSERKIAVSLENDTLISVIGEKLAFVFDSSGIKKAQDNNARDIVLFGADYDSIEIEKPIGVFGSFTADRIDAETDLSGEIIICSSEKHKSDLYFCTPNCDVSVFGAEKNFPDEKNDLYITAKSLNGATLNTNAYPIYDENDLSVAENNKLCDSAKLIIKSGFGLTGDHHFNVPVNIDFENEIDFSDNHIYFEFENESKCVINCEEDIVISSESLIFDAPNCELYWNGNAPLFELMDMYQQLLSYQSKKCDLGGDAEYDRIKIKMPFEKNPCIYGDLYFEEYKNTFRAYFPYSVNFSDLTNVFLDIESDADIRFERQNDDGSVNLSGGAVIIIKDKNGCESRKILCLKRAENIIPAVYISTYGGEAIESKTVYKDAVFSMSASGTEFDSIEPTHIRVRGRGNSTWKWDKKPYKIHFDIPTSVFGLAKAEEWALFSNYADKSLMRNRVALEMAKELSFEYVPTQYCVDVFVNGEYMGVYTFGEHFEEGEGRVEVKKNSQKSDCGFLLELGGVVAGVDIKGMNYFHAGLAKFVLIKSPDYELMTSSQFTFIKNYVKKANDAIVDHSGYEDYIDVDSLIDWLILIELSNNTDCSYRRSTFITKDNGGKLKMQTPWDFDLAFGNFSKDVQDFSIWASSNPDDDYVGETWTTHLLEDDSFKAKFKLRWDEVKDRLIERANEVIDETYSDIYASAMENFERWDILGRKVAFERKDTYLYPTFDSQINYLKDFIDERAEWIDNQVSEW